MIEDCRIVFLKFGFSSVSKATAVFGSEWESEAEIFV